MSAQKEGRSALAKGTPAIRKAEQDATAEQGEIYTPHPLTKVIPAMSEKDREALQANMLVRGLRVPILVKGNQIIDGINRYEICKKFGIELHFDEYEGKDEDILDEIVSRNVPRRHLSTRQRADIAAELVNMRQGERTDLEPCLKSSKVSQSVAAKRLNVSRSSVQAAIREKRKAESAPAAKPEVPKSEPKPERLLSLRVRDWATKFRKKFASELPEAQVKLVNDLFSKWVGNVPHLDLESVNLVARSKPVTVREYFIDMKGGKTA